MESKGFDSKSLFDNIIDGQKHYIKIAGITRESIKNQLVAVDWAKLIGDTGLLTIEEVNNLINDKIREIIK